MAERICRKAHRLNTPGVLGHVVIVGEQHLRRVLKSYATYYNEVRTHLSLVKDAPIPRACQANGRVVSLPVLRGLNHHYLRV